MLLSMTIVPCSKGQKSPEMEARRHLGYDNRFLLGASLTTAQQAGDSQLVDTAGNVGKAEVTQLGRAEQGRTTEGTSCQTAFLRATGGADGRRRAG